MNNLIRLTIFLSWLLFVTGIFASEKADLIFVGSNIVTVDANRPTAEAVAVLNEKILAVGTREDVLSLRSDDTRVIDLGKKALVPGFIDAHGHMAGVGGYLKMANLSSPPVGTVEKIEDVVELLKKHIEAKAIPDGDWVFGYGYDDSLIGEGRHPNRDDLDLASTAHPIVLIHVSGHLAAVNSAALAATGITAETDDPPGGVIRRRSGTRVPNGVMEETAGFAFRKPMAKYSTSDSLKQSFRESARLHATFGITTVQDGGTSLDHVQLFRDAAAESPFPVDIVAFPFANGLDEETRNSISHDEDYSGGFRVGGVKFIIDGSPQGRTAYLSKPYNEGPPGAAPDYRAYPIYPADAYKEEVTHFIQRGIPVLAHANGDGAIDIMIDGVEKAVSGVDLPDHRSVIIHAQLMREDQLHRVKRLGLVPSYYAAHPYFWGDWHRLSFGDERAAFISPVARTAELGIPFTVHNDAPIVPPDVMRLLWITVNRETRSGYILGPDQRATPMQALHAVTLGAAYQYFEEDTKGSITAGKQADLVILGANPLTVDPASIKDIPVIETFARGKSVYRSH
ncbi:MAG: amidohydrolase [Gammaproteobacteria bacterium]|nr:amidohydrolase [Gammaproteobacteria bacterium]MBT4493042.1 amidohydrolase [Gammaproteobacteria bacterium]MBT7369922.1 amidohydrolase [Gammaproteobacteria bacterium]